MKTKPNRTTIFIMNLWVSRIRQLLVLAVALFFYSCVDEMNLIGFKGSNSKFSSRFIEIQLDSCNVFLTDSTYTQNTYQQGETIRLLVGSYNDPKFGRAKSIAFTQYARNSSPDTIKSQAVFDSLELFLEFDYYVYGSTGTTPERYYIHELTDTLSSLYTTSDYTNYINGSTIPYDPTPLATIDTVVSFTYFTEQAAISTGKSITKVRTKLSNTFGQRIFDFAKNNRADFLSDVTSKAFFKGLAIVPDDANTKIVGFTPDGLDGNKTKVAYSKMVLHYHDDTDTLKFEFVFHGSAGSATYIRGLSSFNNINVDRSGTPELSGHPLYSSFSPNDGLLYSQLGDGLVTSINFGNFYDFADSYSDLDSTMIIDSGELVIDGVEYENGFGPINEYYLRVLEDDNHFKRNNGGFQDSLDLKLYQVNPRHGTLDGTFLVLDDLNTPVILPFREHSYKTHLTLFLQELFTKEPSKTRFRNFGLFPRYPPKGKSINRTLINRNNIKLRIYYTIPTVKK